MKRVSEVRRAITNIEDVFFDHPPDDVERDPRNGKPLWPEPDEGILDTPTVEKESENQEEPPRADDLFEVDGIDEDQVAEALGGVPGKEITKRVKRGGVDALAWYVPFHLDDKRWPWGIYIPISSLLFMANVPLQRLSLGSRGGLDARMRIGFRALHQHELFHFATEYMSAQWECITGRACYVPASQKLKDPSKGYRVREERLANAHMIRSFWGGAGHLRLKGRAEALREFSESQPAGYREGGLFTRRPNFLSELHGLADDYLNCIQGFDTSRLSAVNLADLYPLHPFLDWRHCPIHVVHDEQRLNLPSVELDLFRSIPVIVETKRFKKWLKKMHPRYTKKWRNIRETLATTTMVAGWKIWTGKLRHTGKRHKGPGTVYSVKVGGSARAHLLHSPDPPGWKWEAIEIGMHEEMMHG